MPLELQANQVAVEIAEEIRKLRPVAFRRVRGGIGEQRDNLRSAGSPPARILQQPAQQTNCLLAHQTVGIGQATLGHR